MAEKLIIREAAWLLGEQRAEVDVLPEEMVEADLDGLGIAAQAANAGVDLYQVEPEAPPQRRQASAISGEFTWGGRA